MNERLERIWELEAQGKSGWYAERYVDMLSKIHGWERLYNEEAVQVVYYDRLLDMDPTRRISAVRFLVLEEKRTTRSPAKIDAINAWLQSNPE